MSKHFGKCALCGKKCELTYEHIPPKAAFNSRPSKMYSGEKLLLDGDRLPWNVEGLTYVSHQKGAGRYSLCQQCNNDTGTWYGDSYKEIAYVIAGALETWKNEPVQGIGIKEIYGARFIKQVISMFCSVNTYNFLQGYRNPYQAENKAQHSPLFQTIIDAQLALYDASNMMEELRAFVLDKNAVGLDKSKFKICMYVTDSKMLKLNGVSTVLNLEGNSFITVSEITAAPLGFLLYFNPPDGFNHTGVDITVLADYGYDEKVNIEFPFQVLEMNTIFPNDYRSREQIENDANNTKKWCEENENK